MDFSTVVGSAGVALLLLAFLLNLLHKVEQDSALYPALNLIGASLSCYASWLIGFAPFVVLEGTWAVVALLALLRALRRRSL